MRAFSKGLMVVFALAAAGTWGCEGQQQCPINSFVKTHPQTETVKYVKVKPGLSKEQIWSQVMTVLEGQKYQFVTLQRDPGLLVTAWKWYAYPGDPGLESGGYRVRMVVQFLGDRWDHLAVQAPAEWRTKEVHQKGYDNLALVEALRALNKLYGNPYEE